MRQETDIALVKSIATRVAEQFAGTTIQSIAFNREENNMYIYDVTLTNGSVVNFSVPVNTDFETIYVLAQGSTNENDNNNWRIILDTSEAVSSMQFQRREGTTWVTRSSIGSSVTTDKFILENTSGSLQFTKADGAVRKLIEPSVDTNGAVVGNIQGRTVLSSSGEYLAIRPTGEVLEGDVNPTAMGYTSFDEFILQNRTQLRAVATGITLNLQNVPDDTVLRVSVTNIDTSDLIFESEPEADFNAGMGIAVTNGANVINFDEVDAIPSGLDVSARYQFSNTVEVQGSVTSEGSPFDPQFYFNGQERGQLIEELNIAFEEELTSNLEALTGDDRLDYESLKNKPSNITDLSQHSVTELNDVTSAGSGAIITDAERTKLETPASMTTNIRIINNADLTGTTYTAQLSDFENFAHTVFDFRTSSQVTFKLPDNIIPIDNIWTIKVFGGTGTRVLLEAFGTGLIDAETDHLLEYEEALTCIHLGGNVHRILSDYLFGVVEPNANNFVNTSSFDDNVLTLGREGLGDLTSTLEIHDVDNTASGTPHVESLSLVNTGTTRQTLNFGVIPFQFTGLNGGKLGLEYKIITHSQGGFEPDFRSLTLDYGSGITFTFNIADQELDVNNIIELEIANIDYSAILSTSPTVTVEVDVRGFQYIGEFDFISLYNREKSIIHDEIVTIAQVESGKVESELLPLINDNSSGINLVKDEIVSIEDRLNHQLLDLPADVVSLLSNDITVTTHPSTTLTATLYNRSLGMDGSQTTFLDADKNIVGADTLSGLINASSPRANKLIESTFAEYSDGDTILHAYDGVSVSTPLVKRDGGNLVGIKFIPAVPPSTTTVTKYPTPANLLQHDWYAIDTAPNRVATASELFFVQNVPTVSSTLNFNYRYSANGSFGSTQSATLAGVGGSTDVGATYTLALPDGETITVILDWLASTRSIRVEMIPHANNPNFFIFGTEVNMNYVATENVPETPATTENIVIGTYSPTIAMAIKPTLERVDSDLSTLVITSDIGGFDTGYLLNDLFGSTDAGHISVLANTNVEIYDYKNYTPNATLIGSFLNRINLPYLGWFTENYNENNTAEFDTRMSVSNGLGNLTDVFNLIQEVDGKMVQANIVSDGADKYILEFVELV